MHGPMFHERYRLRHRLAQNECTDVWVAVDTKDRNREVVIKMYAVKARMDLSLIETVCSGYLSFSLRHDNLLLPIASSIVRGRPYIVLPWQSGGSLRRRITARPAHDAPTESELLALARRLGNLLAYLHRNGLVHQDVTPENIFPTAQGDYLLSDFGLSRTLHTMLAHPTGPNGIFHIPYASPQRFVERSAEPPDDVFSLGVVLHECATGRLPWEGAGGEALLKDAAPPDLDRSVSDDFAAMILRCLAKDARERPTAADIEQWAAAYRIPTTARRPTRPIASPPPKAPERTSKMEPVARSEDPRATARAGDGAAAQATGTAGARRTPAAEAPRSGHHTPSPLPAANLQRILAAMSHTVRTPMQVITGYARVLGERLADRVAPDEAAAFAEIEAHSTQLLATVDALVYYAGVSYGLRPLQPGPVRLDLLLGTIVAARQQTAAQRAITLALHNDLGEVQVQGDGELLHRAVSEVLHNAVSHTRTGGVTVRLRANGDETVRIDIEDTGTGMSPAFLPHACEPFMREGGEHDPQPGRPGLGLAIARACIEQHKGHIEITSTPARGTRVMLALPDRVASQQPAAKQRPTAPVVLVVEDHEPTAAYMRFVLGGIYTVVHAADAAEALTALEQHPVAAICMDISLRDNVSGIDLTRALRSDTHYADLPIIAVTAHAFEQDRRTCLDAGCDDVLFKPFDRRDLLSRLETLIAARSVRTSPAY
jgi:signal transduction histidine kinase/CheY-like chemotaxis protein